MSVSPLEPCQDCGSNQEFCCDYSRIRAETAIQTAFLASKELEVAQVALEEARQALRVARNLLDEAREPLQGVGHRLDCPAIQDSDECDCPAAEVEALLDRIELTLEG